MDNIFILAFLHILQRLSIFRTDLFTWDPLHKRDVMDSYIPEDPSFSWLVEIQTICSEIISTFNLGKNYKNILQMCEDLGIEMMKLRNFHLTRFIDSVYFLVFINLRIDYSTVRLASVNVQQMFQWKASKENSSAVKDRSKAEEANCVLRKINSWVFCLNLSGCADIYNLSNIF